MFGGIDRGWGMDGGRKESRICTVAPSEPNLEMETETGVDI